jgi:hypothetical protein
MQALLEQLPPAAVQSWQSWPPLPQEVLLLPPMHRPFAQQPLAHVAALHVAIAHAWP